MEVFHDRDDDYARWLHAHPGGYVVNERRTGGLLLHQVGCRNLRTVGAAMGKSTTVRPKVCGTDRTELEAWAQGQGRKLKRCGNCDP
jgi:hypothetical protein